MRFKNYFVTTFIVALSLFMNASLKAQQYQVQDSFAMAVPLSKSFSKIVVSDGVTLIYNQSDAEGLAISAASNNYIRNIQVQVVGDTLKVGLRKYLKDDKVVPEYKVYAASKSCSFISLTNASRVIVLGALTVDSLMIDASNAAKIDAELSLKYLSLKLSSASLAQLHGNVIDAVLVVADASQLAGSDLVVNDVKISAKGASKMFAQVRNNCQIIASGASKIVLKGKPAELKKELTGLSRVRVNN